VREESKDILTFCKFLDTIPFWRFAPEPNEDFALQAWRIIATVAARRGPTANTDFTASRSIYGARTRFAPPQTANTLLVARH
jgi:hypothetical protein